MNVDRRSSASAVKPLFTLQHSGLSNWDGNGNGNSSGNGVTSICFLRNSGLCDSYQSQYLDSDARPGHNDNSNVDSDSCSESDSDSDSDTSFDGMELKSHALLSSSRNHQSSIQPSGSSGGGGSRCNLPQHLNVNASAINTATSLSFANALLASTHTNGYAYIWDLSRRRVVKTLDEGDAFLNHFDHNLGPGLALGVVNADGDGNGNGRRHLFHQRRDADGTIIIYDEEYNAVQLLQCFSQTFCQASACTTSTITIGGDQSSSDRNSTSYSDSVPSHIGGNLIATPSKHEAFAQLWDVRIGDGMGNKSKSVGVIHGAKMNGDDVSKWRDEGMLTSLKLSSSYHCGQGNSDGIISDGIRRCGGGQTTFLACGMESGKIFIHDLRMTGKEEFQVTAQDIIETEACSVSFGINPILCLDSYQSCDEKNKVKDKDKGAGSAGALITRSTAKRSGTHLDTACHTFKNSLIVIAGKAADAAELMAKPEHDRGTVAVIKATSLKDVPMDDNHPESTPTTLPSRIRMLARVRAKVGTCRLSNELSNNGKPGVGVCRFRPDGKVFAVGGWDKRVRIYSRTSANILITLRGLNEESVTALDWAGGEISEELMREGVLASGSNDGKISLWRAFPRN
eukprot:CAMPEP_0194128340 /NCGR_PEP_ID=MMETSP0150-20130528/60997_1 /TAXON_ID=122233 /ORGANISM="Chaetoceros debilis, Strain MM31A-1" /LENGTH=624 /DNA_ID=CAMNT_0038822323 /DNA_START=138 /DNA_END=2012 /DNA_ORIENTATION=+